MLQVITLSCLTSVSMEIRKTKSNPKKNEKVIKLEKKTMILSILHLKMKLLRLLKKLKLLVLVNVKTQRK